MPHPDVFWYRLNGMGAQKNAPQKVLVTLFHIKRKWNIIYKYLKNKSLFKRLKYASPNALNIKYFWALSATIIGGFWISLNYPIFNLKKTVCPKNVWMRHWTWTSTMSHEIMQPVNNELNSTRTRKWDQFSLKRWKSTNTYRKDLSWLHFEDVPRVQEKQQVKEEKFLYTRFCRLSNISK